MKNATIGGMCPFQFAAHWCESGLSNTLNLLDAKIMHVMKNIAQIFPSKQEKGSKKNATDVVYSNEVIINIYSI